MIQEPLRTQLDEVAASSPMELIFIRKRNANLLMAGAESGYGRPVHTGRHCCIQ